MADSAYARAGVDTGQAGRGVAALVDVLRTIDTGREQRALLGSGHYANVLRLAGNTGLALSTDGVGHQADRGRAAGPVRHGRDRLHRDERERRDLRRRRPDRGARLHRRRAGRTTRVLAAIGQGLKAGAEDAGVEIPGGELAVVPELIRGHPSPQRHRPRGDVRRAGGARPDRDRRRDGVRATP